MTDHCAAIHRRHDLWRLASVRYTRVFLIIKCVAQQRYGHALSPRKIVFKTVTIPTNFSRLNKTAKRKHRVYMVCFLYVFDEKWCEEKHSLFCEIRKKIFWNAFCFFFFLEFETGFKIDIGTQGVQKRYVNLKTKSKKMCFRFTAVVFSTDHRLPIASNKSELETWNVSISWLIFCFRKKFGTPMRLY